jgi:hypothetical protein
MGPPATIRTRCESAVPRSSTGPRRTPLSGPCPAGRRRTGARRRSLGPSRAHRAGIVIPAAAGHRRRLHGYQPGWSESCDASMLGVWARWAHTARARHALMISARRGALSPPPAGRSAPLVRTPARLERVRRVGVVGRHAPPHFSGVTTSGARAARSAGRSGIGEGTAATGGFLPRPAPPHLTATDIHPREPRDGTTAATPRREGLGILATRVVPRPPVLSRGPASCPERSVRSAGIAQTELHTAAACHGRRGRSRAFMPSGPWIAPLLMTQDEAGAELLCPPVRGLRPSWW